MDNELDQVKPPEPITNKDYVDTSLAEITDGRFIRKPEYGADYIAYVDLKRQEFTKTLEQCLHLVLTPKLEDALGGISLKKLGSVSNDLKSKLGSPRNLKVILRQSGEEEKQYYYQTKIKELGDLEVHIVGTIEEKDVMNITGVVSTSNGIRSDKGNPPRLIATSVVVGKKDVGYVNIMEAGGRINMNLGREKNLSRVFYRSSNSTLYIDELNTQLDLVAMFHEYGHYVDFERLVDPWEGSRRKVLREIGLSLEIASLRNSGRLEEMSTRIYGMLDRAISDKERSRRNEFDEGNLGITKGQEDDEVSMLKLLKKWSAESLYLEGVSVAEDQERIASLYSLAIQETLAGIYDFSDLGNVFKTAFQISKKQHEAAWATYDSGLAEGEGFSDKVREMRRGKDSENEVEYRMEARRFLSLVRRTFPGISATSIVEKISLNGTISGNQVFITYLVGRNALNGNREDFHSFTLYEGDNRYTITLTTGNMYLYIRDDNTGESIECAPGSPASMTNMKILEPALLALKGLNTLMENGREDTRFDYSSIDELVSLVYLRFKQLPNIALFADLGNQGIAALLGIEPDKVTALHRLHILTKNITSEYFRIFPEIQMPAFDSQTGYKLFGFTYITMLQCYTKEVLKRLGVKDVPEISTWDSPTMMRYFAMAAELFSKELISRENKP